MIDENEYRKRATMNRILIIICIFSAVVIYIVYIIKEYDVRVAERDEFFSKDDKYKIALEQTYESSFVPFYLYRPRVVVGKKVDDKWIYKKSFEIPIATPDGLRRGNYSIDWIDGGVIIKIIKVKHEENRTYRVYWEDVF